MNEKQKDEIGLETFLSDWMKISMTFWESMVSIWPAFITSGGGNSLLIPMTEFLMGLTGDINDIMNDHNLAMVALTARMQHERNYNDEQLARLTLCPGLTLIPPG